MKRFKRVNHCAFSALLAVLLTLSTMTGAFASNATFNIPKAPMTVDKDVITVAAHSQAYVTPEILGINNVTARETEIPSTYMSSATASTTPILGVFGSDINESPNPYLYNYSYNCYAKEKGLTLAPDHTLSKGISGSPAAADLTVVPEYGTSVSLYLRPDILLGDSDTKAYTTLIAALPENKDTNTTNNYNPYQVSYPITSTYNFLDSLYSLSGVCDTINRETGKVCRYGDPTVITSNLEKYTKGLQCYILSRLAADNAKQKVVAVVDPINSKDGIFYGVDEKTSVQGTTTQSRAGEFVADTTRNIVDVLGKTSQKGTVGGTAGKTYYVLTAAEIAQADIIVTSGVQNNDSDEGAFRDLLIKYIDPTDTKTISKLKSIPIMSTRFNTVGAIGANTVENLLGMAYWSAYCYPEYLNPIYVATYFYQNFYHITNNSSLQTAIAANFAGASIPKGYGYTTDLTGYDPSKIENQIISGMNYYEANKSNLTNTMLYTNGHTGVTGWNIDWTTGIGATTTAISAVTSPQSVLLNGKEADVQVYNINGSNYVKLRDIASLISGSAAQFSVDFDTTKSTMMTTTGKAYTVIGGELTKDSSNATSCVSSAWKLSVNGAVRWSSVYNIGGNNYFKLRDLGEIYNFGVTFDATANAAVITAK